MNKASTESPNHTRRSLQTASSHTVRITTCAGSSFSGQSLKILETFDGSDFFLQMFTFENVANALIAFTGGSGCKGVRSLGV